MSFLHPCLCSLKYYCQQMGVYQEREGGREGREGGGESQSIYVFDNSNKDSRKWYLYSIYCVAGAILNT